MEKPACYWQILVRKCQKITSPFGYQSIGCHKPALPVLNNIRLCGREAI